MSPLTYTVNDNNGNIIERVDRPTQYVHGSDKQIIRKVETALEGREEGDTVEIILSPEDGFGEYYQELTFTDDMTNVPPELHTIGAEVEFQNDHSETKIFRVTKIENRTLTVDGNHPYAGKNIIYRITIQGVRNACADEITNTLKQKPQMH